MKALFAINKYFVKYKWHLLGGLLFIILSNLFALYPAQITRKTIDYIGEALKQKAATGESVWQNEMLQTFTAEFLQLLFLVIGAPILKGLFMFFMRQTIIVMSRHVEYEQKNEIYKQYQALPQSFFKQHATGDMMARISEDVGQVRMYVGPAIMYTLNLIVLFVLTITAMVKVNAELTVYVLIPLPFLSISIYYVSDIINRKSLKLQSQLSTISTFVQEAFSGMRVIKGFNREKTFVKNFGESTNEYYLRSVDLVKTEATFAPLITLLIGLSTLITIYIGGKKAILGEISIGNIAEFVMYVNMLTWPVTSIGWVTSVIQKAAASQQRINEFLEVKSEIVNESEEPFQLVGNLEFREVTFQYNQTNITALQGVNFTVKAGQTIGITGNTGSGKSSIAALLARVYDVSSGGIYIDGKNLKDINLTAFKKQIGYVPQDVFLFSDSIRNNITFSANNSNEDEVVKVAKQAVLHENIMQFANAYDTVIGERGITLSGGQKQRLSIARAMYANPHLYIFDDCLSAVDTETENQILENLRQVSKGKTTLMISHRASTIKNADKILFFDQGRLLEEGTHDELIKLNGRYADMYNKQQIELNNSAA